MSLQPRLWGRYLGQNVRKYRWLSPWGSQSLMLPGRTLPEHPPGFYQCSFLTFPFFLNWCFCNLGYEVDISGKLCEDVYECLLQGSCLLFCKGGQWRNTPGHFQHSFLTLTFLLQMPLQPGVRGRHLGQAVRRHRWVSLAGSRSPVLPGRAMPEHPWVIPVHLPRGKGLWRGDGKLPGSGRVCQWSRSLRQWKVRETLMVCVPDTIGLTVSPSTNWKSAS